MMLWLALAVPALAAVVARAAPRTAPAGALAAAVPAWVLLAGGDRAASGFAWIEGGGLDVGLRLDGLSSVMTAMVATIGLVVVIYAAGYFAGDPRRGSALAGLLAFLAAMQGLVLADGFLTLLIFWELVGALSARLIAYSREKPEAGPAAVRAFLTTRAADLGLYLAVLALFAATGSLAFTAERPAGALGALVGLGLVVAAVGKSAQAPLHTWLTAAMAGPTPVSALLHSATMVAAGVYLLARTHDLLAGWPLQVAGWIGAITAVAGAMIALGQTDLKRVLAGSTTSQLGLMFVGVAAFGPAVAVFHLVAHAAGKSALFLAAGMFGHARGGTRLADLRGAGRDDQLALTAFGVAALSIAAVPPFAAFWSKDHIAAAATSEPAWLVLVLLAGAGSAAYLLRPWLVLTAHARPRPPVRRGRRPMLAGLTAAAVASVLVGALGEPLAARLGAPPLPTSVTSLVLSLLAIAAGAAAVLLRVRVPAALAAAAARELYAGALLRAVVERPVRALSRASDIVDRRLVDGAVDGTARATLRLAHAQERVDRRGVDAAVDGLARLVGRSGDDLRRLQSGRLFEYLRDAVLGGAAVAAVVALSALL